LAKKKVEELWESDFPPFISVQVLQELYVNLVRKGISDNEANEIIQDYLNWEVIDNDSSLLLEAIQEKKRWKVSLWDALILAAAKQARVSVLWSEDLNTNQNYGGVVVLNPLAT